MVRWLISRFFASVPIEITLSFMQFHHLFNEYFRNHTLYVSLSSLFKIFPAGFLGRLSARKTFLGHLKAASLFLQKSIISIPDNFEPIFKTATTATTSIHFGSESPITAASTISGCEYSTSSTSRDATFSPP